MEAYRVGKLPASFWVISVLGLLWNGFGAYLYLLAKLNPQGVMANAPPAMRDYVADMPLWAHIGWSVGIWGSFLGSVLMVLRSRHAVSAFLASLAGAVLSFAGQAMAGVLGLGEPLMILSVIVFLWWYGRHCQTQGLLR